MRGDEIKSLKGDWGVGGSGRVIFLRWMMICEMKGWGGHPHLFLTTQAASWTNGFWGPHLGVVFPRGRVSVERGGEL